MPDISGLELMDAYLSDLGYASNGMGGFAAITTTDVLSWTGLMGFEMPYYQSAMLLKMSRAYARQANMGGDTPQPYVPDVVVEANEKKASVGRSLRTIMRG